MIRNRIISKSTQKGLLKNVQDGISRPLGSQEIQKIQKWNLGINVSSLRC